LKTFFVFLFPQPSPNKQSFLFVFVDLHSRNNQIHEEIIRRSNKNGDDTIEIYDVPYSEHSSFDELRECVALWKPLWIIPTVNVSANATIQKLLRC
jgi:hypothetical protein